MEKKSLKRLYLEMAGILTALLLVIVFIIILFYPYLPFLQMDWGGVENSELKKVSFDIDEIKKIDMKEYGIETGLREYEFFYCGDKLYVYDYDENIIYQLKENGEKIIIKIFRG